MSQEETTKSLGNRPKIVLLLLASLSAGLNWINVSSVFPFMALEFRQDVAALGIITAVFVIGEGAMQIPAAYLARKYGQVRMLILGTSIASVATLLTAFAPSIFFVALFRFLCATGIAFVFAPGYIIISKFFPSSSGGRAISFFGASALVGNIIALLPDAILPAYLGWRTTMASNGAAEVLISVCLVILLGKEKDVPTKTNTSTPFYQIRSILFNRWIIVVSLVMLSMEIGIVLVSNFSIFYLENELKQGPLIAGIIAGMIPVFGLGGSVGFGGIYDRTNRIKLLVALTGVITAAGLAFAALGSVSGVILAGSIVGFGNNAGYIVCIASIGRGNLKNNNDQERVLGIAWILSFSVLGSFIAPILFSYLVLSLGYEIAWLGCALLMTALVVPTVFLRQEKEKILST